MLPCGMSYQEKAKEYTRQWQEACKESQENGNRNTVYTFRMLQILHDMAEEDVYPNGHFGDDACNVWSMFRM